MENKVGTSGKKVHEFNIMVDNVPYFVEAEPFPFNDQVRYRVTVNGGSTDIFVWDDDIQLFRALDDDAATLPDGLIRSITANLLEVQQ